MPCKTHNSSLITHNCLKCFLLRGCPQTSNFNFKDFFSHFTALFDRLGRIYKKVVVENGIFTVVIATVATIIYLKFER